MVGRKKLFESVEKQQKMIVKINDQQV